MTADHVLQHMLQTITCIKINFLYSKLHDSLFILVTKRLAWMLVNCCSVPCKNKQNNVSACEFSLTSQNFTLFSNKLLLNLLWNSTTFQDQTTKFANFPCCITSAQYCTWQAKWQNNELNLTLTDYFLNWLV